MKIEFSGATHTGRVRKHNEDSYAIEPEYGLFVIADGMGGHGSGDVASKIAINKIVNSMKQGKELDQAILDAHQAILDAAEQGTGSSSMGCTVVALQIKGDLYKIAWVGDSRAYLWNGKILRQLTEDHSYVQELINAGVLTRKDARDHPQRSVITRALGSGTNRDLKVDLISGTLFPGQKILLCSDGLSSELDNGEIEKILAQEQQSKGAVHKLIDAANENGGSDNITVILVSKPGKARDVTMPRKAVDVGVKSGNRTFFIVFIIAALLLIMALGYIFWGGKKQSNSSRSSGILKNRANFKNFSATPGKLSSKPLPRLGQKTKKEEKAF